MFDTFEVRRFALPQGMVIRGRVGGSGPPLLLLHGHPQTHVMWHRVADELAHDFSVVALDLRGYGDSSRPAADAVHASYSKRAMAQDAVAVMAQLGHAQFDICAHDRGARVAHRLALDHPACVRRMMLLDIAPTLDMYERTTEAFARAYWHWFFLIQPPPLPERLIESNPTAYLRTAMGRRHAGLGAFDPQAMDEYERCIAQRGSATAICEDYRASASIDLDHDRVDRAAGVRVTAPLRVLWGAYGTVAHCFDVLELWQAAATQVAGHPLECGHYIAEEQPLELLAEMRQFFSQGVNE